MRRRSSNLGFAIFLIVLAIFYYEITYKAEGIKEEIISSIDENRASERIKYKEERKFEIEKIESIKIKAIKSRIIFSKDSSMLKTKIIVKGSNLEDLFIKANKNIAEFLSKKKISNAEVKIISPKNLNIEISNLNGEERINGGGNIIINDLYSEIQISDSKSAVIDSSYGKIRVKNIEKNAEIKTRYSRIDVENIEGDVTISTKYGERIYAKNIGGDLTISTKYTPLHLNSIKGKLIIVNRYSDKIQLKDFKSATIKTSYSRVFLDTGESSIISGKENSVICKNLGECSVVGKNNKISGDINFGKIKGKFDTISLTIKGGEIIEESGDINLDIPEVSDDFKIVIVDTPIFVNFNDVDNIHFLIKAIDSTLNSNFLEIKNGGRELKAIYGNTKDRYKFILSGKYSKITINN